MPITKLAEKRAFKVRANVISPDENYYSFKLATGQTVDKILNVASFDDTALLTAAGVSASVSAGKVFRDDNYGNLYSRNAGNSLTSGSTNNFLAGNSTGDALSTGDYNIAIGNESLLYSNGSQNVTVGYQAGRGQLGQNTAVNVIIGYQAGYNVSTAQNNVIAGWQAGYQIGDGSSNVILGKEAGYGNASDAPDQCIIIGSGAGYSVTDAQDSVLIGHTAGYSTTDGSYNVAIGYQTGYHNQTGDGNAIIGYQAGLGTSGLSNYSNNIAVGYQAGYSLRTNAQYNVFIGKESGRAATTAVRDVSVGERAGYNITTGTDNIIIGHRAGYNLTTQDCSVILGTSAAAYSTGGYNVIIGHEAGRGPEAISSHYYNVLIGYQAGKVLQLGNSNNVIIGYQAGIRLKSAGNVLIGDGAAGYSITASNLTCVGNNAGFWNPNGSRNTAIGDHAIYGNSGQSNEQNTAVGYYALGSTYTASYNTAIGYETGKWNRYGTNNVLVGHQTGFGNVATSQYNNTMVGYQSGYSATTGTSANVFLGYQAGYSETGAHKLIIANNSTEGLIEGDFQQKSLDINGSLEISAGVRVNEFSNDAAMSDASSAALPTEYAVKNFVEQSIISGVFTLPQAPSATVTFSTTLSDTNYTVTGDIENTVDGQPSIYSYTTTSKTVSGFTIRLSGTPDSANYKLNYQVKSTAAGVVVDGVGFFTDNEHAWTRQQYSPYNEITLNGGSPSASWDLSTQQFVVVNLDANGGILNPINMRAGISGFTMIVKSSGSYTLDFDSQYLWEAGLPPTITDTGTDVISFISDGTYMYGSYSQNYS